MGRQVLAAFLDKKVAETKYELYEFLECEKHALFHISEYNYCCRCKKSFKCLNMINIIDNEKWQKMYKDTNPNCARGGDCICKFVAKADISSQSFDVSLLCTLLLNSHSLNINGSEKHHIRSILSHRNNDISHPTKPAITDARFNFAWNELEVSILELAGICSPEFRSQMEREVMNKKSGFLSFVTSCKELGFHPEILEETIKKHGQSQAKLKDARVKQLQQKKKEKQEAVRMKEREIEEWLAYRQDHIHSAYRSTRRRKEDIRISDHEEKVTTKVTVEEKRKAPLSQRQLKEMEMKRKLRIARIKQLQPEKERQEREERLAHNKEVHNQHKSRGSSDENRETLSRLTFPAQCNLALLGKTGAGKSTTGNLLVGKQNCFKTSGLAGSETSMCKDATVVRRRTTYKVVDTLGFLDTTLEYKDLQCRIIPFLDKTSPGPHATLYVTEARRFTEEEEESIEMYKSMFGSEILKYTIVIFTKLGENTREEDYMSHLHTYLKKILEECGYRHIFLPSPKSPSMGAKIDELFQMVDLMILRNNGSYFTNNMFKAQQNIIEEKLKEQQQILKREEKEMIQKIKADISDQMQQKIDDLQKKVDVSRSENEKKGKELEKLRRELESREKTINACKQQLKVAK